MREQINSSRRTEKAILACHIMVALEAVTGFLSGLTIGSLTVLPELSESTSLVLLIEFISRALGLLLFYIAGRCLQGDNRQLALGACIAIGLCFTLSLGQSMLSVVMTAKSASLANALTAAALGAEMATVRGYVFYLYIRGLMDIQKYSVTRGFEILGDKDRSK